MRVKVGKVHGDVYRDAQSKSNKLERHTEE